MKILHQWTDAKNEPFVIREAPDGDLLFSGGGKNALPARNWRWPVESLVREILRLTEELASRRSRRDIFVAELRDALGLELADRDEIGLATRAEQVRVERDRLAEEVERLKAVLDADDKLMDEATFAAGQDDGVAAERLRLRPLLKRCLAALEVADGGPWQPGTSPAAIRLEAADDIRAALGYEVTDRGWDRAGKEKP